MSDEPSDRAEAPAAVSDRDDWDHHWDQYGDTASENPGPTFRRRFIVERLADVDRTSRILDVGSGTGELAAELHAAYPTAELLGRRVEPDRSGGFENEGPSRRLPAEAISPVRATPPAEFRGWATHAVCSEVLEHVDDPRSLLINAGAYMAPGCRLLVTVPGGPVTTLDRHIGHRRHYRPEDLAALLRSAGFEVLEANGIGFPAFNLYRLVVKALGDRAIGMLESSTPSRPARVAMRAFDASLRVSARPSRLGWQTFATARFRAAP